MSDFEHNSERFGYINLEDFDGVQTALMHLGFNPGAIDGKNGPRTQKAVRAFQAFANIQVDGLVGPETRHYLTVELNERAEE